MCGTAASSYLHSGARFLAGIKVSLWLSLCCIFVGGCCLLFDLGRPFVALNILQFINLNSWAARGFWLLVLAFITVCLLLFVVSKSSSHLLSSRWGFYKRHRGVFASALAWISIIVSIALALYTGFLLYDCIAIPFWRTFFLPTLFLGGATNLGIVLFACINSIASLKTKPSITVNTKSYISISLAVLGLEAMLIITFLNAASFSVFESASASVYYLVSGELSLMFWLTVVGIGLVATFLLSLSLFAWRGKKCVVVINTIIATCALIGSFALRYGIVFSGILLYQ